MIEKIAKLLALAENAGTQEEAELAMSRAQHLATIHSIDIARLRAAEPDIRRSKPTMKFVKIGPRRKHSNAPMIELLWSIAQNNTIRMTMRHDNTGCTMYGMPEDLETTELMFNALAIQMVTAGERYLATDEWRHESMWSEARYAYIPMTKQSARKGFYEGFTSTISERLFAANRKATQEATVAEPGTELVLRNKKDEVKDYFESQTGRLGRWKGASSSQSRSGYNAGSHAGRSASLGNSAGVGGGRGAISA
jgi:hypothetical protein